MRLHELDTLGLAPNGGVYGTMTSGTYVPATLTADEDFWRIIGLYLAEGCLAVDGRRQRLCWSFNHHGEEDLVEFVASYWRALGVKATTQSKPTSRVVVVSSRLLGRWFSQTLGLGTNCYNKRIPDLAWSLPPRLKEALLRGLWDGDGSWSFVSGGPSVAFDYGTASRLLADGILRLLGDLGVAARLKIGRTTKSTTDNYWIVISGADQLEACLFLLPGDEQATVFESLGRQSKRIRPTGYRRLSKNAAWVRVTNTRRLKYTGPVYSVEVPGAHTIVTTGGLVVHNCFPKDSRALLRIAEDAGYDFGLLRGVIDVNEEQYEIVTEKVVRLAGGSVEGITVAVWGLTFKARTDDLRDSPALEVIRRLRDRGARVQAYDPAVDRPLEGVEVRADAYAACEGAAILVVLTEWDEFRWLDFDKVKAALAAPLVLDARNLLDPGALRRRGFVYEGLGRL